MSDSKPALNGYVPSGAVCPDHAVQALSMHRRFKKAGIGHDAGVVLLKLDKRERPFAQH